MKTAKTMNAMNAMKAIVKLMCAMMLALLLAGWNAGGARAIEYEYGDRADEIARIQEALTELDYYYADITGHYGRKTERAVRLFQRKQRLTQTGVCDKITIARLYEKAGFEVPVFPQEEKDSLAEWTMSVLRQGDTGSAVRLLQESLTELDYYDGAITGHYGRLTKEAVRVFQRRNDLSSDGIAGPRTLGQIAELMGGAWQNTEEPID